MRTSREPDMPLWPTIPPAHPLRRSRSVSEAARPRAEPSSNRAARLQGGHDTGDDRHQKAEAARAVPEVGRGAGLAQSLPSSALFDSRTRARSEALAAQARSCM